MPTLLFSVAQSFSTLISKALAILYHRYGNTDETIEQIEKKQVNELIELLKRLDNKVVQQVVFYFENDFNGIFETVNDLDDNQLNNFNSLLKIYIESIPDVSEYTGFDFEEYFLTFFSNIKGQIESYSIEYEVYVKKREIRNPMEVKTKVVANETTFAIYMHI